MKTLNEEILKIKHLFKFKKGDRLVMENTEMCEKVDDQSPSYVPPLCSELDGVKKLVPIFEEYGLYRATLSNGCPINCAKTKKDQENYNKNKNKFYEKETLDIVLPNEVNAGEIQKYLVDKGYLPRYRTENGVKKDNIDWDFGDTSAKAFGDFIEDKLGIDVGIQTLQDLQNYLDLLGFNTGSLGFGEKVYDAIKWIVDFTDKGLSTIVNTPEYNEIIKYIVNVFLKELKGLKVANIDECGTYVCDYNVRYNPTLSNVEVVKFTHNTIDIRSRISGTFRLNLCNPFGSWMHETEKNNFEVIVEGQLGYYFEVTDGKFCLKIKVNSVEASSVTTPHLKTIYTPCKFIFKGDLEKNVVNLHIISPPCGPGSMNYDKIVKYVYTVPLKKEIEKKICSNGYCLKIDDIIKLIKGEEDISNLSDLMVDMCPPAPKSKTKKTTKTKSKTCLEKTTGTSSGETYKNLNQRSRDFGGGDFYHYGKI